MKALISVYDKSGIVEFARFLVDKGVQIISTGSTYKLLRDNGISAQSVENYTGFEEILDGRVKTLHYKIHAGILADTAKSTHLQAMKKYNIEQIDIVVVNLYPFEQVAYRTDNEAELIENIDIGGPTMIRAAAKNFKRVLVVVESKDYLQVIDNFENIDETFRKKFAMKAFALTAYYDSVIINKFGIPSKNISVGMKLKKVLRYGENPHQKAAMYKAPLQKGLANTVQLQGKDISYNNLLDIDVAYRMMIEAGYFFPNKIMCTIIKHNTPCGVACLDNALDAYDRALSTDEVSAFGGVIGIDATIDAPLAQKIASRFYEVVVAFDFEPQALNILSKKKNLIVIKLDRIDYNAYKNHKDIKSLIGGYMIQDNDTLNSFNYTIASQITPTVKQIEELKFAWFVAKFAKSNAIVYAKDMSTIAIGSGQTSRIDSAKFAALRAKELGLDLQGSAMASDGFFPFRDSVDFAKSIGVGAIVQPGGSIRDEEVINAANEHQILMLITKERHFRH